MLKRRSTKGIRRRPYKKQVSGYEKYVAEVFCDRLNELDISQTQLLLDNGGRITAPTLSRVLKGHGGASINTVAAIAEMLGLRIIIKPIEEDDEITD